MAKELSQEQIEAARQFVSAFAETHTYGGGLQVVLKVYDERGFIQGRFASVDGWHGREAAVEQVALAFADRFVR